MLRFCLLFSLFLFNSPSHAQSAEAPLRSQWVRSSYHNGIKNGAIGTGLAIAVRPEGDKRYAIVVELLAFRPVKLQPGSNLRILSAAEVVLDLAPAAAPWSVASDADATIKGRTAYSVRQAYPLTLDQLNALRGSPKPTLQILHAEGIMELKLRTSELDAMLEFVRQP
jgi:hypothetical protein